MELREALTTTGAVRDFTDDPVSDEVVARILDAARFAPNGGNAQSWRVAVVRDPTIRAEVRDHYVAVYHEYAAMKSAGLRPFAPVTDAAAESEAVESGRRAHRQGADATGFAAGYDRVPVMLAVAADLRLVAAMDRDLDRYTIVGGASVYPFVWSILLAARDEGLGGVITTMPIRHEPALVEVLGLPEHHALAAIVVLGHPVDAKSRLRRKPVGDFASLDRFDGPPLG